MVIERRRSRDRVVGRCILREREEECGEPSA